MEKDVTLAIILKLGRLLEKDKDFKVIYTRKIDEFLH
jgi:N-acetylmuramoyl-L-alanine amidase